MPEDGRCIEVIPERREGSPRGACEVVTVLLAGLMPDPRFWNTPEPEITVARDELGSERNGDQRLAPVTTADEF